MRKVAIIPASFLALAIWLSNESPGGTLSASWNTALDQLSLTDEGSYTRVQLEGATVPGQAPGLPSLPSRLVYLVVPPGAVVTDLRLTATETPVAAGIVVYPSQPDRTPDDPAADFIEPDAAVFGWNPVYPAQIGTLVGTSWLGGYQLAVVRLNPVRYDSGRRELLLAASITATLSYEETDAPSDAAVSVPDTARQRVLDLVSNPQDVDRFSPMYQEEGLPSADTRRPSPIITAGDGTAIYLLITSSALAPAFQPLVDRRTLQGKTGQLVTIETIQTAFAGVDLPDKIRNCVRQYYQNHGTAWVALGGSESVVPPRYVEGNIPVDLYYGCLDGDWNADMDDTYGEAQVDNTDLSPEVWVGRIPAQTSAQATAYVNKVERFENTPPGGFSGSMLIGSNLSWFMSGLARPIGYDDHDPVAESEAPMRNLYRNVIQPYWQAMPLDLLFTTYSTWDTTACGDYGVTPEHMTARLNWGYHYVYLWGSSNGSSGAGLDAAMGAALTNSNRPSIMYVTASSTAAYDQQEPCISEAFLRNANGGAVAYVGATRSAASTDYHATLFFKEVFQNRLPTVGEAFGTAMMKEAPYRIYKDNWRSWYLSLCLHGDPAISFKEAESGRHLQIISPNGCEILPDNGDMLIRWNASGTGFSADEMVKLQYSADGGTTWLPVPGAQERPFNSRIFIWEGHQLPAGTRYRVRVVSLSSPTVYDSSTRDFTIGPLYILTVQSTPNTNLLVTGTHPNYTNYTYSMLLSRPIELTAPVVSGYNFSRWAGANGNTLTYDSTLRFTCQGNKTTTAEYASPVGSRSYYVNDDIPESGFAPGNDDNDGLSPLRPIRHIQQVFNRYADVAAVYVSAGVFEENLQISRSYSNLVIEGAYGGRTVIDGGSVGRCLTLTGVGSCTLRGLTLRNGWADTGGAIRTTAYAVQLSRCEIMSSTATNSGGAIYVGGVSLNVSNSVLAGNASPIGGGIDVYHSPVVIANSLLHGNSASVVGGAVSGRGSSHVTIRGCTLAENTAAQRAGGLLVSDNGVADVANSIFWFNHASSGPQMYLAGAAQLAAAFCDVEGGAQQVAKDPQATLSWRDSNASADPDFISPAGPDGHPATWMDNDFHISIRSACRDAGDPQFVAGFLETDIDGQPRIQSGLVDMGADETPRLADLNDDGDVDGDDQTEFEGCATGPGIPYHPSSLPTICPLSTDAQGLLWADLDGDGDVDQADFAGLLAAFTGPAIRPDLDRDFDVDDTDMQIMMTCLSGSQAPQNDPGCRAADHDGDEDVDQTDFGLLQRCLSGDGIMADPTCAE
ncbi:MAG: C25 family cysteine peptidase [Phycisphaerae bacterium]|nr:C25 family cysteine peptidase [Phycisphaerae bacterium]